MTGIALVLAGGVCFAVHFWCESQCTRLDVETGRRDAGALIDDYGSNRGWYPRWKIPSILAVLSGISLWLFAVGACTIPAQSRDLDGRHAGSPLKPWFDRPEERQGPVLQRRRRLGAQRSRLGIEGRQVPRARAASPVAAEQGTAAAAGRSRHGLGRRPDRCRHHRAEPRRPHHGVAALGV